MTSARRSRLSAAPRPCVRRCSNTTNNWRSAIDRTPGPKSDQYPRDSAAEDNLIHDIGLVDKQAAGVEIAMAARISLTHNSIYQVPRAGINVGDGTWGGHQITYNDVFDTVLETGDHGAFNSWGRGRYWHPDRKEMDRRVAAEPSLATLDAIEPIVMRRNRFKCDHGWDVDLDDGATNYVIEENLMLSGGGSSCVKAFTGSCATIFS